MKVANTGTNVSMYTCVCLPLRECYGCAVEWQSLVGCTSHQLQYLAPKREQRLDLYIQYSTSTGNTSTDLVSLIGCIRELVSFVLEIGSIMDQRWTPVRMLLNLLDTIEHSSVWEIQRTGVSCVGLNCLDYLYVTLWSYVVVCIYLCSNLHSDVSCITDYAPMSLIVGHSIG